MTVTLVYMLLCVLDVQVRLIVYIEKNASREQHPDLPNDLSVLFVVSLTAAYARPHKEKLHRAQMDSFTLTVNTGTRGHLWRAF